jgi:hypothetical protein
LKGTSHDQRNMTRIMLLTVAILAMLFVAFYFIGLDGRHPDLYLPHDLPQSVHVQGG